MSRRRLGFSCSIVILGLSMTVSDGLAGTIDFGLIPSDGAVSGPPGSVVGWGYSLTNNSLTDWFLTTGLNSDSFANGTASLLFDFPILGPGIALSVPFNTTTGAGLYQLAWDAGAPVGFTNSGNFVLSGEWWDGDPLNGGNFLFTEPDIGVPYTAAATQGSAAVPEPGSLWLCLVVCAAILWRQSRSKCCRS